MDSEDAREFFKKKGKPKQRENEKISGTQNKNPWSTVIARPKKHTENTFKQNIGNDNSGRGRGRGTGNLQAQAQSDYVPDPHNGAYPSPQTKWTNEQIEIYYYIASTLANGVEEDIIADLTEREGDEILIHLLVGKSAIQARIKQENERYS